jgi:hypothetical protein
MFNPVGIYNNRFTSLIDGKEFRFNPNDSRERAAAEKLVAAHNEQVIAAREAKAGRKLTQHEVINGLTGRTDPRTAQQRHLDAMKSVKMADAGPTTKYDSYLAEKKAAFEAAELASLSVEEREYRRAKELRDAEIQQQVAAEEKAAHLAKVAPQLDKLNKIRESMLWDASYSAPELEAVAFAIKSLSTPGADEVAAEVAFKSVLDNQDRRDKDAWEEYRQRKTALEDAAKNLKRPGEVLTPPAPEPQSEPVPEQPETDLWPQLLPHLASLNHPDQLQAAFDAVKAGDSEALSAVIEAVNGDGA